MTGFSLRTLGFPEIHGDDIRFGGAILDDKVLDLKDWG